MDKIRIVGGTPLRGTISIGGAKNAALTLMPACLLTDETVSLSNLPHLVDITTMANLLAQHGVAMALNGNSPNGGHTGRVLELTAAEITNTTAPYDLVRKMRASVLVLGPLLARFGNAKVSLPGGCAIGTRPVDLHLKALEAMGAKIEGIGTGTIRVTGVEKLHGCDYSVLPDRIETGTYMVAAAITRGDIELVGARRDLQSAVEKVLIEAGVEIEDTERGFRVRADRKPIKGVDIMTEPYPGFPTDMQAQLMALMATAEGASMITETIFENRFMHVPELSRMGARVNVHGSSAIVRGVPKLSGAPVMATDLRASVSLVLAGLAAHGETVVRRVYHLDRGYERVEEKLAACGATIERLKDNEAAE